MSLINFIEKLQKKPRYIRIQILWLSVFVCMLAIVSLWVVSLGSSVSLVQEKTAPEKLKDAVPGLGEALKASIGSFFKKDNLEEEENKEESPNARSGSRLEDVGKIKPSKLPLSF